MKLTHSMLPKHFGPKGSVVLLDALKGVTTIDSFCENVESNSIRMPTYDDTPELSVNCWKGDMMELLMEAWFQYSNTINTFNVSKVGEIPHPMLIDNYTIVDRDGGDDIEDHGVDAFATTDAPGGVTIQVKYRQKRNNLTRNQLATFIVESSNPLYSAERGKRLVITTGNGDGGMGRGIISNINKYYQFDDIYYVNRFLLSEHMDGTSFWDRFYQSVCDAIPL